ncbi:hypothetical protein [Photobacterium damselae]|uniref:Uncharacterized protein n=2 Tax=Photobacterium damselae TaxID=38293 RepID=D0Z589_PHODD|nr:hypothetical protein [Photobacterium damselae]EEZ39123.1 hypothetical protein VDA_000139 [Photobacterium damselae subsp. damselae CIP 102761]PSW76500.1 hypothetical protein CTN07_22375 [Photobacterium damselae]SPY46083.1 Uncharacterised protein [Photobacterium damselae]
MNTRSKTATKFYTSERADSSVQIGLAGREVDSESVIREGNATHRLSSLEVLQAPALRAPCAAHISRANARKAAIFKRAWSLAAQKALRFGGEKCTYFAACLKVVYCQIKLTHTESRQQYGDLMKRNNEYLKQLKGRLSHYESKTDLLHREQTIADLLPRIKSAQIRQSYYIDLIFCTGLEL